MRPYPLMPERSQVGNIYTPYEVLHGLQGLGSAPYDLRMYHNEGVGRLGDTATPDSPELAEFKAKAKRASLINSAVSMTFGFGLAYWLFKR